MNRGIAKLAMAIAVLTPQHLAAADAVGLPRRALTEAEMIELNANMDCVDSAQRGNNVTETEALEIARQAVLISDTWPIASATFKASRDECGWDVLVTRSSAGPGGHRSIRINTRGKVLVYGRGL